MKKILLTLALVIFATSVYAQTSAGTKSKIAWDQDAPSLAEASGYTYLYYADSSIVGVAFTNVTCIGTITPFQCSTPFPAFTPGSHTLVFTANNLSGESPRSTPILNFTFVILPPGPKNVTIK
jgi:beta-xylosidase